MKTRVVTLLLLRRGDEVLLAMKKRGFGAGRWNGVGGKLEPGETIEQAMVRECQEEIGVTPTQYHKVAEHDFQELFDGEPMHMLVHAFVASAWQGEPVETEEMAPRWFKVAELPYDTMWADDPHWLPQVLAGKRLRTTFVMNPDETVKDFTIMEVDKL